MNNHRIHCYKCGRFIGKKGLIDIFYDDYNGGYEEGYSLCERCLNLKNKKNLNTLED